MSSQINPNNIDGNYPVAGVPNDTQGMRDNFTNTKTNFQYAADEISELQTRSVLKSALTGTTLDNNLNDNLIYAVKLQDVSETYLQLAETAGSITIDYSAAPVQFITTTGSISLSFTNFPAAGSAGSIDLVLRINSAAHTVTLPAAVNLGTTGIQGLSASTLTFAETGTYQFRFSSVDGGVSITIFDLNRANSHFTNAVDITANTAATSATTGALTVTGGVGIGGNLYVTGQIVGNITVTGVSVVGNVIGGNIVTAGTVFGNVDSENIAANNVSVTTLTAQDSTTISIASETSFLEQVYVDNDVRVTGNLIGDIDSENITANNLAVTTVSASDSTTVSFVSETSFYEQVFVDGDIVITGNITPATTTRIGGVRAGPGANISNTGLLTIDTANLAFSFGNFTANNNILEIVNSDEDMILATSGNAEIQLVGNIGFYKPNGLPPDTANRFFQATSDGQIKILVSNSDPLLGAVEIIGSTTGNTVAPGVVGSMLHVTGQTSEDCRLYFDGVGGYASIVGRRFNGTAESPTQVLSGQDVVRINATAATDAGVGNVAMAQISITALEDQYTTDQGSSITFTVTPVGSNAAARVDVATISTANGVSATKFTTTGNVAAGNVNSYVTLTAGTLTKAPLVFTAGNILTTAAPGAVGYDGTVFYATPQSTERGLIRTEQLFVPDSDYTLTNQAALQTMFGVGATLSSGTRYAYRILSTIYKTANNLPLQYALGGTATLARHTYQTLTTTSAALATVSTPAVFKNILTTNFATAVSVTNNLNGAGYYTLQVNGVVNVTTGGTWFPQIGFTDVPGVGAYLAAGSSLEIWPIGEAGANVSIGNWS